MKSVYDINQLDVDTYVLNGLDGGYSIVRECVHGCYYYADCGDILEDGVETDLVVYDIDENHIPCCS